MSSRKTVGVLFVLLTSVGTIVAAAPADTNSVSGVLRRVAVTEREIIVARPGADGKESYTTVAVTADTIITRDGKPIELQDLKAEEAVTVRTEKQEGRLTAVHIRVGAAAPEARPAAEMRPPAPADAPPPGTRIAKVRKVLRLVDRVLEQVENRINPPPPPAEPPPPPPKP
jgi:hypothetical protein